MRPRSKLFLLWVLTILLGIFVSILTKIPLTVTTLQQPGGVTQPTVHTAGGSLLYIIILIVVTLISTYFMLRLRGRLFKYAIVAIVLISLYVGTLEVLALFALIFNLPITLWEGLVLAGIFSALVWQIRNKFPNAVTTIYGGLVISFLSVAVAPLYLFLFLALMSVYDFIAVFRTKSMQSLTLKLSEVTMVPFAFIAGDASRIHQRLEGDTTAKVALLGLGDAIVPGAFIAGVFISSPGQILLPLLTFLGAYIGLYGNLWVAQRTKSMLPALPLICIGSLFGYVAGVLL